MTIFTGGNLEDNQKQYLDKIASLFYNVEQSAGVRVYHTDPVDVAFIMAYGKGYRFFYMLGAEFGHDVIQKIILKNRNANTRNYTAEKFLKDLETVSGRSASQFFSGWIFPGKYEKYSPADFVDENHNGIIDFAEKGEVIADPPKPGG